MRERLVLPFPPLQLMQTLLCTRLDVDVDDSLHAQPSLLPGVSRGRCRHAFEMLPDIMLLRPPMPVKIKQPVGAELLRPGPSVLGWCSPEGQAAWESQHLLDMRTLQ